MLSWMQMTFGCLCGSRDIRDSVHKAGARIVDGVLGESGIVVRLRPSNCSLVSGNREDEGGGW